MQLSRLTVTFLAAFATLTFMRPAGALALPVQHVGRRQLAPGALHGAYLGPMQPRAELSLYISLQGQHAAEIDRFIQTQNTPGSPLFRRYLTPQQFGAYFGASNRDYAQALLTLRAHGFAIDNLPANHADIEVHAPVAIVESFFGTPVDLRRSPHGRIFFSNRYAPTFPASLHAIAVAGLDDYLQWKPRVRTGTPNTTVNALTGWGPADIESAYDLTPVYAQYMGQGETIIDATYGLVRPRDYGMFESKFGLHAKLTQTALHSPPLDPYGESTLDVEWMSAIAPRANILLVSAANQSIGFLKMHRYIVNSLSADHIVSTSWGLCEQQFNHGMGYAMGGDQRLFQQAQTEGQWWLAAAGDQGSNDCELPAYGPVAVDYPGSSPYVLDVGGTRLTPAAITNGDYTGWADERVWNDSCGAGAGGVSTMFVEPAYQKLVVPNGYMREVPDVALMADGCDRGGYIIAYRHRFQGNWYGTSFAAPEWAAFLALVQQRYGATPIENPLYRLYTLGASSAYSTLFHDIVQGDNSYKGVPGYTAGPGYDQASGLGSFVGAALQAAY
jgi:subtilase family serine protease